MTLESIIEAVREHYLARYREAVRDYRARFDPGGPEVLLELDRGVAQAYRLYRMDLASGAVEPPNFTEVNPSGHLSFEPTHGVVDGMSVTLHPIVWNGVEFDVHPALTDEGALQAWGLKWLDPGETATPDADGLGSYIHSITAPRRSADGSAFSIDFGSAPIQAWRDLFQLLRTGGTTVVSIHSRTVLASDANEPG